MTTHLTYQWLDDPEPRPTKQPTTNKCKRCGFEGQATKTYADLWASQDECAYCHQTKPKKPMSPYTHPGWLGPRQIVEVWTLHWEGWTQAKIAEHLDVSKQTIWGIINHRSHNDVYEQLIKEQQK